MPSRRHVFPPSLLVTMAGIRVAFSAVPAYPLAYPTATQNSGVPHDTSFSHATPRGTRFRVNECVASSWTKMTGSAVTMFLVLRPTDRQRPLVAQVRLSRAGGLSTSLLVQRW